MKPSFGLILAWAVTAWMPVFAAESDERDIIVVVEGSETTDGAIMIAVYASEDTFLREPFLSRRVKPGPEGRTKIIFSREELPVEFAISLYHDINDNGTMETGFMRIPKEPYGLSRNPGFRMGPPLYAPSVVSRDEVEGEIVIRLK